MTPASEAERPQPHAPERGKAESVPNRDGRTSIHPVRQHAAAPVLPASGDAADRAARTAPRRQPHRQWSKVRASLRTEFNAPHSPTGGVAYALIRHTLPREFGNVMMGKRNELPLDATGIAGAAGIPMTVAGAAHPSIVARWPGPTVSP